MSVDTPTQAEVIRALAKQQIDSVYTALPGVVQSYDSARQVVSVQLVPAKAVVDENRERDTEKLPVVTDVPVIFPGSGVYSITFPIEQGDSVLVLFASASIGKWLATDSPDDPLFDQAGKFEDAVCIPGLRTFNANKGSTASDSFVINGQVCIGSAAANDPVVRESDLNDWITNTYDAHNHGGGAPSNIGSSVDGSPDLKVP